MTSGPAAPAPELPEEHVPGRKECQILVAARAQFLEQGFSDTSMDAIARRAGVSKATLYAYFPSKEALFSHLIQVECKEKCVTLPSPDLDQGVQPALHALCSHFVRHFLTKESTAFFQTVSGERWRFPDLCKLYFKSGRQIVVDFVVAYLEQAKAKGLLTFEDAGIAAEQLMNLALLDTPFRVALGLELRDQQEAERIMEAGLAVFLKAYGVSETRS
jgi:TetR/AcrR family transcriptional regulator, mexJK operon transcriptional repressor